MRFPPNPTNLSIMMLMRRIALFLLLGTVLIASFLAYHPGLTGTFVFDDQINILENSHLRITNLSPSTLLHAALSGGSGPLGRPISILSFALNYYFTGVNPFYFKLTNLIIHMLNGIGIFVLTTLILEVARKRHWPDSSPAQIRWISLAVCAVWTLHPYNLTGVLYIVQRMTSLAAFFCIWGLALYVWGRDRLGKEKDGIVPILLSVFVLTPLAALSKETGALLPLFMLITEVTIFDLKEADVMTRRFVVGIFTLSVAVPTIVAFAYVASNPNRITAGYISRAFTLNERVMTEARVLWLYIRQIILPNVGQMGLFLDDLPTSHGFLNPVSTLLSFMGILGLALIAFVTRKRAPLISFGLLFFLAGHLLESTIYPLEIMFEHRNYLPMYGLILTCMFYLLHQSHRTPYFRLRLTAAVLLISLFTADTYTRATQWANPFDLAKNELIHHPDSARANAEMAGIYISITAKTKSGDEMNYLNAKYYYEKATELDPNFTTGLFGLILSSSKRGKPVQHEWITDLTYRLGHSVVASDTGNQLTLLVTCQIQNLCKLDKVDMEGLLKAPLQNQTISSSAKALVLSALSYYLVNIAQDYPAALAVMYQTVKINPSELQYRSTLIQLLYALGKESEAARQFSTLKMIDKSGLYTTEIEAQHTLSR
jgi:hypothetical protein